MHLLQPFRLRVFIDRSIVEVFVNEKRCAAVRVYPQRRDSLGISLLSRGLPAQLRVLDVWKMRSIYCSDSEEKDY